MSMKPLAEMAWVEDERGFGADVLRIGSETWPAEHLEALELAIDINAAHEAALAPLQALLARAAAWLATRGTHAADCNFGRMNMRTAERLGCTCGYIHLMNAFDAAEPGQWVPLEKYQQLQAVLNDALEENGERIWRGRCERALEFFALPWGMNLSPAEVIVNTSATPLEGAERVLAAVLAILEGREPEPAKPSSIAAFNDVLEENGEHMYHGARGGR